MSAKMQNRVIKTELVEWRKLSWFQDKLKAIPPEAKQRLKESLRANGFIQPFHVWQENGHRWILDGHHRKLVMEELEAEGVLAPSLLPANFVKCKDRSDAAKCVLLFSSIYANVQPNELADFLTTHDLDFATLQLEVDLPDFASLTDLMTPDTASVDAFANATQFSDSAVVRIRVSRETVARDAFKEALLAFCEKFKLTYEVTS